jgi:uncharacterized protein YcbK (DUF882 family)
MKKKIIKGLLLLLLVSVAIFFFYCNNIQLANPQLRQWYAQLKQSLRQKGYEPKLLMISTQRFKWHNAIQVKFSGAATNSRYLHGDAIDFLVWDVNGDGQSDSKDVAIVVGILDKEIVQNKGGIGTYITEGSFINRQMVHIDGRGYRARWGQQ